MRCGTETDWPPSQLESWSMETNKTCFWRSLRSFTEFRIDFLKYTNLFDLESSTLTNLSSFRFMVYFHHVKFKVLYQIAITLWAIKSIAKQKNTPLILYWTLVDMKPSRLISSMLHATGQPGWAEISAILVKLLKIYSFSGSSILLPEASIT